METPDAPPVMFATADGAKRTRRAPRANGGYISDISGFYLSRVDGFWAGRPYEYALLRYTMAQESGDPAAHESGMGAIMAIRQILRIATQDTLVHATAPLRGSRPPPKRNVVISRCCLVHFSRNL